VGDAVREVSRACSLNVVLDSAVSGRVSLRFVDAVASEVLAGLARAASLEVTQEGTIYRLRPLARKNAIDLNINRGRLSANISGADVRDVVAALSEQAHVSMVPDADLTGTLSASLSDVALDQGIRAIFQGAGYTVTVRRGILHIAGGNAAGGSKGGEPAATATAAPGRASAARSGTIDSSGAASRQQKPR
jgi:type II secretory pathway component HofQ